MRFTAKMQHIIEQAYEARAQLNAHNVTIEVRDAVYDAIAELDSGRLRVAEKIHGEWIVNQWLKKAVLLSFCIEDNTVISDGYTHYYDKIPAKFADFNSSQFQQAGFRVVPTAIVRRGAYIAPKVVLMPSFVNIGG
ncbi:MAG TPA: 2,3,4,5-tetrahydropyridine-2,6-dicarboxylate N-succinyltransferase, partial [Gammaproteobacteria bacterium]|nr:2,3,4,5-tetrahydropyridine-2,6-dicarboxylate N-succinyltransferase [Gammaproteobacteria bacterium]